MDRAADMLLGRAIDPSLKDFNFNVFYGNESKGVDIADAAQTLPMFADRRAVLVKRAEASRPMLCDSLAALHPKSRRNHMPDIHRC